MIYIASDHAGFEYKQKLIEHIKKSDMEVLDLGPFVLDPADDYPDFVLPCAKKVSENPGSIGIVLGGSGQGEAMAANKIKGIRAVVYYGGNEELVALSRQHNNANILSLGARFMSFEEAARAVDLFIETGFHGGRHEARLSKIRELEN